MYIYIHRSQDISVEGTPCSAVSRILMGRGFRAQRGRERAVPPRRPPAARAAIRVTKEEWLSARCLRLAQPIAPVRSFCRGTFPKMRNVDVRLSGKGNPNSHGARPVHLIITSGFGLVGCQ